MKLFHLNSKKKAFEKEKIYTEQHKKDYAEKTERWEQYELLHRSRMSTKPGITGMWQVSGRSDITDFEEVVKLDTGYIENWSIGLDCRILLKTVRSVVKSEGSV